MSKFLPCFVRVYNEKKILFLSYRNQIREAFLFVIDSAMYYILIVIMIILQIIIIIVYFSAAAPYTTYLLIPYSKSGTEKTVLIHYFDYKVL